MPPDLDPGPRPLRELRRRRDLTWKFLRGVDAYRAGELIHANPNWDDEQREAYRNGWSWARNEMRKPL